MENHPKISTLVNAQGESSSEKVQGFCGKSYNSNASGTTCGSGYSSNETGTSSTAEELDILI